MTDPLAARCTLPYPHQGHCRVEAVRTVVRIGTEGAVKLLVEIIRQLRDNNYSDWPDVLERDVLPALAATPAPDSQPAPEERDVEL